MAITRSVVVAQGKGGVGKTSVTTNVGGLAAAAGLRVLVVDLDPQGNVARDLGLELDSGRGLLGALVAGAPVPVTAGVRDRLDVVQGGPEVADLAGLMYARASRGGTTLSQTLGASLGSVAGGYDLILIDTPPGEKVLVEAALGVASAVLIPTRADDASLDGLARVAERFAAARAINPELRLAGVLLFAVGSRSRRLEHGVRRSIEGIVGSAAPIFESRVRHLESAAVDSRRAGLLVHELEDAAVEDRRARLAALRAGKTPGDGLLVRNAEGLAGDYESVTRELLTRLAEIEREVGAA